MQWFKENRQTLGVTLLVLVYITLNMVLTYRGFYFFNLLPVFVLLVFLAFTRLDIIYFIVIACTPLSIPLIEFARSSPVDFYIPTEPILFGVLLIVIFKLARKNFIDRRIINHPVTLAIIFNIFWILLHALPAVCPWYRLNFYLHEFGFLPLFIYWPFIFLKTRGISLK